MLNEGKIITINGENYIVMSRISYEDGAYAFTTKLNKDYEPTEDNFIWKERNQNIEIITDKNLIQQLLPIFQKEIREKILKGELL